MFSLFEEAGPTHLEIGHSGGGCGDLIDNDPPDACDLVFLNYALSAI